MEGRAGGARRIADMGSASDRFDLSGERALVTGAGSGLGLAMAEAFAEHGAQVAVLDKDPAAAERGATRAAEAGEPVLALTADVAEPGAAEASVQAVTEAWGGLDILVNNAGAGWLGPAEETPIERFRLTYEINVFAPFAFSKAAFRPMSAQGRGCIINTASIAGFKALHPDQDIAYHSAKAALIMFTRALAVEWAGRGIRVNAVAPGFMRTRPPAESAPPVAWDYHASRIPLGRPGLPEDVKGAAVFLASPAASYITGAVLVVDGGNMGM